MRHVDAPARLAALRRYGFEDMPGEAELQGLVRVAAIVAGVPTATLNLLEDTEQHNYVTYGFDTGSCPREDSMCVVALREQAPLHVADASVDPRFESNPWVDGRLDTIRLYASSPLITDDGWMIGTLCVFDSHPRALGADALQALDDLAAQAMALIERRRLARTAKDALQAKSRFLASISHELRTPLHGVLGSLDLLVQDELVEPALTHAGLAHRAATSLLSLVDDVLDLARAEAGQLTLSPRPFSPAELVADVADGLRVLAQRKGLRLETRVEGTYCGAVLGDRDRIRQVLVNLVGNAVKFTEAGEVEVRLQADERADGQVAVSLTVRDTGRGIPPDELPSLFAPFEQGRSGRLHGGSGLGLSICAELAGLMGGQLRASSDVGAGSTFVVELDLPADVLPDVVAAELGGPSLGGMRVLVADDCEVNRLVTVALLSSLGADADAVADGLAAVTAVNAGAYDLVLLDHEMPGLDGPAAARCIRELAGAAGKGLVFALTGRAADDDVRGCLDAGMDAVLTKPLHLDDLVRALGSARAG